MANRLNLHNILSNILENVYYQPPESIKLTYPAIVYSRSDIPVEYADDGVYILSYKYTVTLIDKNPDSDYLEQIAKLPKCKFDRHFTSGNLNHDVFTIYY